MSGWWTRCTGCGQVFPVTEVGASRFVDLDTGEASVAPVALTHLRERRRTLLDRLLFRHPAIVVCGQLVAIPVPGPDDQATIVEDEP